MGRGPTFVALCGLALATVAAVATSSIEPVAVAAADTAAPNGMVTVPTQDQALAAGSTTLSGTATDNVGVAAVDVAVRDRTSSRWLQPNGSWATAFAWLASTPASPGARSTSWTFTYQATPGSFALQVRARDAAGNADPTKPWVRYTVTATPPPPPPPPPGAKPNIVLVLTDDQRWDTLSAMPNVGSMLAGKGVTFSNGFVVDSLCCPSRATIMKGAYSHSTHVYQLTGADGPFGGKFDDTSTVATWLHGGGYRTALYGKYFNGYDTTRGKTVPPGWDRWGAIATDDVGGGKYYDYDLSLDGTLRRYGSASTDYSTDVLAQHAEDFVRSTPAGQPLFLWFSPYGPHEPATPAPRHQSMFANLAPWRPPSYNEADVSDKPAFIKAIASFSTSTTQRIDNLRRNQLRSLQSVDDAVGRLVQALADTGRLENTMIVYASDNGFLWGEHRWGGTGDRNKQVAYEESIRTPFVVRYDKAVPAARTDNRLVTLIDLAPTWAALAGVAAPGVEGTNLMPVLDSTATTWRDDFLVEHGLTGFPAFCSVRSTADLYVQYATGEEELYLLASDPYQLQNRASDTAQAATLTARRARAHTLCNPTPPNFTWRH